MSAFGYIFLAPDKEQLVPAQEQREALDHHAKSIGLALESFYVEEGTSLKQPFQLRPEGTRLLEGCGAGDMVMTMKAAWVLSSAGEGVRLLQSLRAKGVALYCMDLGENISVDEKRKLMVSEGCAGIVMKLLSALALCEGSTHGEAIRATKRKLKQQGKYIGGPVPFGWEVNEERILIENKAQQKIIQAIIAMREDRWSYRDISRKLKDEFDIQLSHAGVRRILDTDRQKKARSAPSSSDE